MSSSARGSDFPSVTIPYLVWLGAVAGGIAGLLESLAMLVRGAAEGSAVIVNTGVFYAAIWAVAGIVLGLAAAVLTLTRFRLDRPLAGSVLVSVIVLVAAGGYVNVVHLAGMFSGASLAIDALLLAGCCALCVVLVRVWRARLARGRAAPARGRLSRLPRCFSWPSSFRPRRGTPWVLGRALCQRNRAVRGRTSSSSSLTP